MALYSANGVRRTVGALAPLALEDEAVIGSTSTPNVSQFGWTSQDLRSVKDLLRFVDAAMEAAESAQENADYVAGSVQYVQDQSKFIDNEIKAVL